MGPIPHWEFKETTGSRTSGSGSILMGRGGIWTHDHRCPRPVFATFAGHAWQAGYLLVLLALLCVCSDASWDWVSEGVPRSQRIFLWTVGSSRSIRIWLVLCRGEVGEKKPSAAYTDAGPLAQIALRPLQQGWLWWRWRIGRKCHRKRSLEFQWQRLRRLRIRGISWEERVRQWPRIDFAGRSTCHRLIPSSITT